LWLRKKTLKTYFFVGSFSQYFGSIDYQFEGITFDFSAQKLMMSPPLIASDLTFVDPKKFATKAVSEICNNYIVLLLDRYSNFEIEKKI